MLDIMKNSRLYKFLRKIAGDEVSITPVNTIEDCLDDIADVIAGAGENIVVLDTSTDFPLAESVIEDIIVNPLKYVIKDTITNATTYYKVDSITNDSIRLTGTLPVLRQSTGSMQILYGHINKTTGVFTTVLSTTGYYVRLLGSYSALNSELLTVYMNLVESIVTGMAAESKTFATFGIVYNSFTEAAVTNLVTMLNGIYTSNRNSPCTWKISDEYIVTVTGVKIDSNHQAITFSIPYNYTVGSTRYYINATVVLHSEGAADFSGYCHASTVS